jgi:hypothetical protein
MRFATHLRHVLVCVVVGVNAGCSDGTGPKSRTVPNLVRLESSAGDYIGGGETRSYSQANAVITVVAAGARLSFKVTGDEWWVGDLQAPSGLGRLKPGTYGGLPRYSRSDTTTGGISWFGEGPRLPGRHRIVHGRLQRLETSSISAATPAISSAAARPSSSPRRTRRSTSRLPTDACRCLLEDGSAFSRR